jgi:hypothetical protein
MPELLAAKDAVNRKFKELWAAQDAVNRKLKEAWARDSGGVNRKIFSGQKVVVIPRDTSSGNVEEIARWNLDGSGKLYTSNEADYWLDPAIYTDIQFDPGILILAGQNIFDADITIEYSWHKSSVYGYVGLSLAVNNGDYEVLYSRGEFTSEDPWTQHIVKSATSDIVLTKLRLKMETSLHGTGDSGWQSSMDATWVSGGIRIAGKPITEVIISST